MNRAERRKLEKQFGLNKKYQKGTKEEKSEIRERRKEMGTRIHQQNLERVENDQRKAEEEREVKQLQSLVASGKSEVEAKEIIASSRRLDEDRQEKLRKRKERQSTKA